MNTQVILDWVKANILIIVFLVVVLASLIGMPYFASGMNQQVREEVERRAGRLGDLSNLERAQIREPNSDEVRTGVINEWLLERYRQSVEIAKEDANKVLDAAIERNRQGRDVLMSDMFPSPPPHQREILPRQFHERLIRAYDQLLVEIGAGSPSEVDHLREELRQREEQFVGQILARDRAEQLPEEERRRLQEQLSELRLLKYQEKAERYRLYVSREVFNLPVWEQHAIPATAELFERQWRYWIHSDVLRALRAANDNDPTLIQAPVKRVLRLEFVDAPGSAASSDRRGGGGGAGGGGAAGGQSGTPASDAQVGPVTFNHAAEVSRNFRETFTGRSRSPIYDVRYVNLDLVVATDRIPEVLDALARQNFMTVTNLRFSPVDAREAARDGYYYGSEHVSQLSLEIETIWLRAWTAQFMPAATRAALGIPTGSPAGQM